MPTWCIIVLCIGLAFIFIVILAHLKIIKPWQKALVERLGRYQRTIGPGLKMLFPFIERIKRIDMREQVVDVPPQEVITEDNVVVTVDAVIYHEVTDPVKVAYNVRDFRIAVIKLAQTNLRNVVGDLSLDKSLTSREQINAKLRDVLDQATDKWGTKVTRVELQRIEPPRDVTEAMHKQMRAERERRAMVLEAQGVKEATINKAEGDRQARILKAEGEKQSAILRAEGDAEAIERIAKAERFKKIAVAEGEAAAIKNVYSAIHEGDPTNDLLAIKYLEALQEIARGQANKVFLPYEATNVMASLAGVAELFKEKKKGK
ncbi:SPFH/Band 7/PHB domain protein [candidate division WOR-3 bacterium]|uniref:SPFH/Band 7/PHB domain protein n=1 Tax=candidate division WOR-3 bacterium TaxID=2052148 RepID=A0A9D5K875_UNCW3|nr:SPFH/Band 7/PHB domain protein [candidate division WOR-3 bacterium]MBD3364087.1 SPFH/Band 7/PHB domain protein [candidate division WOR-3 bacterium]